MANPRGMLTTLKNLKGNAKACVWTEWMWGVPNTLYASYAALYMAELGLTPQQIGVISSITLAVQTISSLLSGVITDKMGRRFTTFVFDCISWGVPVLLWTFAQSYAWFVAAALFNGLWRITGVSFGLLMAEDLADDELVGVFSLNNVMGLLSAFFAPISAVCVRIWGLTVTMRVVYGFAAVLMWTKFFLLYRITKETGVGMRRMESTKNTGLFRLLWDCRHVFWNLMKSPEMLVTLALLVVFNVVSTLNTTFWSIIVTTRLSVANADVSLYAMLKSFMQLVVIFLIAPRITVSRFKTTLFAVCGAYAASHLILMFTPAQSSVTVAALVVSTLLEALALAAVSPVMNSLLYINVDPEQRARILGMIYAVMILCTTLFPTLAGSLSSWDMRSPLYINLALLAVGVLLTHTLWTQKRRQTQEVEQMVFPNEAFLTATPESQGLSSRAITAMLEAIRSSGKDIHSALVLRNGYILSETYFAPYTARTSHSMYSCSKTFTSMLIGIARGKGLLSLDDKVASFFPDKLPEDPSENLLNMRVSDLLSMATGNDQDTFGYMADSREDWVKIFLSRPVEHEPGTFFRYNTGATYMLSAILTKLTGKTALQLANEWIFSSIGVTAARWEASPQGISMGGTGLRIRPTDMARFGLLLLNEGQWDGKEIVPADYVRLAREKKIDTTNHIDHADWTSGYCYQMWRCSFGAYRADGFGGQFIVVMPKQQAVVVFTSALGSDICYPLDLINEHLCGAFADEALPEDAGAYEELTALSEALYKPAALPVPAEAEAGVPWGRRIRLKNGGILGVVPAFTLYKNRIYVESDMGDADFTYRWGAPELSYFDVQIPGFPRSAQLSLSASWQDGCFTLRIGILGEPFTHGLDMRFADGKAVIEQRAVNDDMTDTLEGVYE